MAARTMAPRDGASAQPAAATTAAGKPFSITKHESGATARGQQMRDATWQPEYSRIQAD
jgi:hypothetical protein